MTLGEEGTAWWRWAWKTPQAAAWARGHEPFVARRAQLEDDLATLAVVENLDVAELLEVDPSDRTKFLEAVFRRISSLASGKLQLLKECRELDNRLGLNPKAQQELRWTIIADVPTEPQEEDPGPAGEKVSSLADRRRRLAAGAS